MTDRPYTDTDVETTAKALADRAHRALGRPDWTALTTTEPYPELDPTLYADWVEQYRAEARAALDALAAAGWIRMDPDEPHVIEFRRDGWTIQHPLRCRPDLFGCEVNRVGESLPGPAGPPPDGLGRYECQLIDGRLSIGARRG